ncbi:hypothetical protein MRB53_041850 [Persea americana]|nr:hypothetical protein MRB53_041850 [Persea americana]
MGERRKWAIIARETRGAGTVTYRLSPQIRGPRDNVVLTSIRQVSRQVCGAHKQLPYQTSLGLHYRKVIAWRHPRKEVGIFQSDCCIGLVISEVGLRANRPSAIIGRRPLETNDMGCFCRAHWADRATRERRGCGSNRGCMKTLLPCVGCAHESRGRECPIRTSGDSSTIEPRVGGWRGVVSDVPGWLVLAVSNLGAAVAKRGADRVQRRVEARAFGTLEALEGAMRVYRTSPCRFGISATNAA